LDGRVLVHEAIETLRARITPTLAIRLVGQDPADTDRALRALADTGAEGVELRDQQLLIPAPDPDRDVSRALRALLDAGADVLECRVVRPSLEALFLDIVRADEAMNPKAAPGPTGSERPPEREPLPPPIPLRELYNETTKRLMQKEWRQLRASGAAFWTSLLVPLFFLLVMPQSFVLAALHPEEGAGDGPPVDFGLIGELTQDPSRLAIAFIPFLVTIVALIAPTSLITHAIIQERETRTLELLVALPVRIQQVIAAKLATAFLFALAVCGACTLALCAEFLLLDLASVADAVGVIALLGATLAYATSSALFVAILSKDFRTANNLAGAVIAPAVLLVMLGTVLLPGGAGRPLTLALLFALAALAVGRAALRTATFERLLD
jgi:ABC-type transport system involved in multi-copper enzyme maturation permease subunit